MSNASDVNMATGLADRPSPLVDHLLESVSSIDIEVDSENCTDEVIGSYSNSRQPLPALKISAYEHNYHDFHFGSGAIYSSSGNSSSSGFHTPAQLSQKSIYVDYSYHLCQSLLQVPSSRPRSRSASLSGVEALSIPSNRMGRSHSLSSCDRYRPCSPSPSDGSEWSSVSNVSPSPNIATSEINTSDSEWHQFGSGGNSQNSFEGSAFQALSIHDTHPSYSNDSTDCSRNAPPNDDGYLPSPYLHRLSIAEEDGQYHQSEGFEIVDLGDSVYGGPPSMEPFLDMPQWPPDDSLPPLFCQAEHDQLYLANVNRVCDPPDMVQTAACPHTENTYGGFYQSINETTGWTPDYQYSSPNQTEFSPVMGEQSLAASHQHQATGLESTEQYPTGYAGSYNASHMYRPGSRRSFSNPKSQDLMPSVFSAATGHGDVLNVMDGPTGKDVLTVDQPSHNTSGARVPQGSGGVRRIREDPLFEIKRELHHMLTEPSITYQHALCRVDEKGDDYIKVFREATLRKPKLAGPAFDKSRKRRKTEKEFFCILCPSTQTTNDNLQNHYRVHLDFKEFQCVNCSRYFRTKSILTRHRKKTAQCLELHSNGFSV